MRILFVRHAACPAKSADFRIAARGLARMVRSIDVLLTSARADAWESATILANAFEHGEPLIEPSLAGDRPDAVLSALTLQSPDATIALVGHDPLLSAVLAHLVGSSVAERFAFKKGGAALVDLPLGPWVSGRLAWFVPPRLLRAVAPAVDRQAVPRKKAS